MFHFLQVPQDSHQEKDTTEPNPHYDRIDYTTITILLERTLSHSVVTHTHVGNTLTKILIRK